MAWRDTRACWSTSASPPCTSPARIRSASGFAWWTPLRPGRRTPWPGPLSATIVGVVPTVRQRNFQEPDPDPVAYVPYRTDPQRFVFLVVRGQGDPGALTSLVREQMRAIEPDLPLFGILTLDQMLAQMRFSSSACLVRCSPSSR